VRELATKLGLEFQDLSLLETALTHSSYLNENPTFSFESNERMEFLGDAVIGMIVARELYEHCPDISEGELTQRRSHVVRSASLARAAQDLDLGRCLRMGRGEEAAGGRERRSNLEAALEALVGAVFLDGGYEAARALVLRILRERINEVVRQGIPRDVKGRLQELTQARGHGQPRYTLLEASGPDHAPTFTVAVEVNGEVYGRGTGNSKGKAEQAAAREALGKLS
jgi:ribonuclease-3